MSTALPSNLSKLKVPELRALLAQHGLESDGTKPVLIKRLQDHQDAAMAAAPPGGDQEDDPHADAPEPAGRAAPEGGKAQRSALAPPLSLLLWPTTTTLLQR